MQPTFKIAPSILSADFTCLGQEIHRIEQARADLVHFDVMDGHFVANLSFGFPVLKAIRAITKLPLDVHLMIEEPERYLAAFVEAGADSISVHAEVCKDIPGVAAQIHDLGVRAAVAINPETDPNPVLAAANHLDMILVMSVHPGFGGQGFIPATVDKLREVERDLRRRGLEVDIEVDGGIKVDNVGLVAAAGANVFVSGSGIFGHGDYDGIVGKMRGEIELVRLAPRHS
jgi:ribulose-phosphate 3-epimerase